MVRIVTARPMGRTVRRRPLPPPARSGRAARRLSSAATRCLSRSRPPSAIAATAPIIAMIGPKDTAPSSNSIAEPIRRAAIPPKAVNLCLSHRMTGSLPVLLKILLPRPWCRLCSLVPRPLRAGAQSGGAAQGQAPPQCGDWRDVAIHRIDRLEADQLGPVGRHALQQARHVCYISICQQSQPPGRLAITSQYLGAQAL